MENKEKQTQPEFRTSIGGQALIEGIMMRGPKKQAIVVRTPDGLVHKVDELKFIKDRYPILGWPIIRGVVNFFGSMINGIKALMYAAEQLPVEDVGEPSKVDIWIQKHFSLEKAEKIIIGLAVVTGVAVAVGLFILLPTLLTGLLGKVEMGSWLRSLIEGVVRIAIFLLYMWLVSKLKDIRRVWMYHGAEHKTINCYERGLELTVENARGQTRRHPRCGTSFLFLVMIVSIIVFSFVKWTNVLMRMLMRLVLLPVVVGVSYEIIKYAGRHDNWLTRIVSAPGKALQGITTAEPDDSMLEVAIEALKLVLPEEKGSDKW